MHRQCGLGAGDCRSGPDRRAQRIENPEHGHTAANVLADQLGVQAVAEKGGAHRIRGALMQVGHAAAAPHSGQLTGDLFQLADGVKRHDGLDVQKCHVRAGILLRCHGEDGDVRR